MRNRPDLLRQTPKPPRSLTSRAAQNRERIACEISSLEVNQRGDRHVSSRIFSFRIFDERDGALRSPTRHRSKGCVVIVVMLGHKAKSAFLGFTLISGAAVLSSCESIK